MSKFTFLFAFLLLQLVSNGQLVGRIQRPLSNDCSPGNAGDDKFICTGGSTLIGTPGQSGYSYYWSPSTGLNNSNIAQPTANPNTTTTYTVLSVPPNLIQNGDFESGFTGFNTDYGSFPNGDGLCSIPGIWGSVGVTSNPSLFYGPWCRSANHTTGGSNSLIVDGSCGIKRRVWYQTVNISQNTTYYFTGWACPLSLNSGNASVTPSLRIRITGSNGSITTTPNLSLPGIPPNDPCEQWYSFSGTWNSGSSTTALIEIFDDNRTQQDNDFALDDLFFSSCPSTSDQVEVSVGNFSPQVTPAGPITYYNQYETPNQVTLTCSGASTYQWYKNGNPISGATNQTYEITFSGLSIYTDYYYVITDCSITASNTVSFSYVGCDDPNDYPVMGIPWSTSWPCMTASNPYQLPNPPGLGTGTVNSWWLYKPSFSLPTCFSINGSGQISNNGSWCSDGVYTKASLNGQEIYMFYTFTTNPGCRTSNSQTKIGVYPNPSRQDSEVNIQSTENITKVEIYNFFGLPIKQMVGNKVKILKFYTSGLKEGVYTSRVITESGEQYLKLIIKE